MLKRVQILLSTYNAEKYLRTQLESFVALENFDEIKVLIRDDGSRDGTRFILKEYREKYGFDIIYGENVGLNESMHRLLCAADENCEYFSYADQDDKWQSDKITLALSVLDEKPKDRPFLYSARSTLTDAFLSPTGQTVYPRKTPNFYNAMIQNVCPGHSQVFNRALLSVVKKYVSPDTYVIDHWIWLCASAFGDFYLDPKATTLYRQHGNNVIGYGASRIAILRNRFRQVFRDVPRKHAAQLSAFLTFYGETLPAPFREEAERFLGAKGFFGRLSYLFSRKVFRQGVFENFCFGFVYLFGRYHNQHDKKGN